MPGYDKTGPVGLGPMTGRRLGRCTNFGDSPKDQPPTAPKNSDENYPEALPRRGLGLGGGLGLGLRNRFRGW